MNTNELFNDLMEDNLLTFKIGKKSYYVVDLPFGKLQTIVQDTKAEIMKDSDAMFSEEDAETLAFLRLLRNADGSKIKGMSKLSIPTLADKLSLNKLEALLSGIASVVTPSAKEVEGN